MPIFMDRHIVPGIEAQNAAEAHREDLKVQDKFGCRCLTYWVDEERGSAFCLIDAPNEEAVIRMHEKAHGLIPYDIIQVNSNVVEAFLGRIHDPDGYYGSDPDLKIFNDPAFRTIMVSKIKNSGLLKYELHREKASKLMGIYHSVLREQIRAYEGREVETSEEGFVASFVSVTQAINCAYAIQNAMHIAGELLEMKLALHAGLPVSNSKLLFGETIGLASGLCFIGKPEQIMMTSIVRELYKEDGRSKDGSANSIMFFTPNNEKFIQSLFECLEGNYSDPNWGIEDFCKHLSLSKSKLYRKCKELTDISPNELLREFRLSKSLQLLKTDRNISQTTFDVGFSSPSYFTKCFQLRFGLSPLQYSREYN